MVGNHHFIHLFPKSTGQSRCSDSNRLIVMDSGQIEEQGTPMDLLSDANFAAASDLNKPSCINIEHQD